nr:hypothetical protein [Deltaproteobacteria bacterium]
WWGRHLVNTLEQSDKINVVSVTSANPAKHDDYANDKGVNLATSYTE